MFKIKKTLLENLVNASENAFPREFFALIGVKGNEELIEEFILIPSIYSESYTVIRKDLMPFDLSIKGSFHSHPSNNNLPSKADLKSFPLFGEIHLILCLPYKIKNIKAFNARGKKISFKVID